MRFSKNSSLILVAFEQQMIKNQIQNQNQKDMLTIMLTTIRSMMPTSTARLSVTVLYYILIYNRSQVYSMRITRPWSTKHWCESVRKPEWPFAYSKYHGQIEETKGRVSTNEQDMRHECDVLGVRSKCHICEDIQCGENINGTCSFQIQGIQYEEMSINIPTVSDVPWAVGGKHRYDFGNASHVCLYLSGSSTGCPSAFLTDYSHCELRCWGYHSGSPSRKSKKNILHTSSWIPEQPTDIWEYPKTVWTSFNQTDFDNEGEYLPKNPKKYGEMFPVRQGYVFTLAGSLDGEEGFEDGDDSVARFRHPEGIDADKNGYVYVADTGNHAIRAISPTGVVTTLAGDGIAGCNDGLSSDNPRFSSPTDVAVLHTTNSLELVLFVADTGNHRIRKVTLSVTDAQNETRRWDRIEVSCFAGLCSNNSSPQPGYADGIGKVARLNAPRGVAVNNDGDIFVTDTNNHLIRKITATGVVSTLAGSTRIAEVNQEGKPLEGCVAPCLAGIPGYADGAFLSSKFEFPHNIIVEKSNGNEELTVFVTDQHFIRQLNLTSEETSTISGKLIEGKRDGQGIEGSFHKPTGIAVTTNGNIYIADSGSCRIRRMTRPLNTLRTISCSDTLQNLVRPSGCSSYDPPIDEFGLLNTPCEGNIYRNYLMKDITSIKLGNDIVGRSIKNCIGSPPLDTLDKYSWGNMSSTIPYSQNLVVDDDVYDIREDPNIGSLLKVKCPKDCSRIPLLVRGGVTDNGFIPDNFSGLYDDSSSICAAAVHVGAIEDLEGGLVDVRIERGRIDDTFISHGLRNNINSDELPAHSNRLFSLRRGLPDFLVETVAGAPVTLLGDACQYKDAMPAQESMFQTPHGLAALSNDLDSSSNFLYIADRNNHAIRAMSAVCSFVCENGGQCVGTNICDCPKGWGGLDCTKPLCENSKCTGRELCVAPNTCACIPGFEKTAFGCKNPTCVQTCHNGGICSAPDTCACPKGWFDSNCTTPVCEQTCGNGGNCTNPNICTCPSQWTGFDCRTPVCTQTCHNGGWCIAPNTCNCPAGWTGHNCNEPICQQGYFQPYSLSQDTIKSWVSHFPCNMSDWCIETNGFDCSQSQRQSVIEKFSFGPKWRHITGRKQPSDKCAYIELAKDALTPFAYLVASNHSLTSFHRYSPLSPYDWISDIRSPWNAFIKPTKNFTRPWTFQHDRQVALVELRNVTLGHYACANEGICIAPDTCACASGWIGFDCRTPVCEAGYYEPEQNFFIASSHVDEELSIFQSFLGNNTYRLDPSSEDGRGYSNPLYSIVEESLTNHSHIKRSFIQMGGNPYVFLNGSMQGGYSCSIRSVTEWENYRTGYLFEHPNFYSRYMNRKIEDDGKTYVLWEKMGWEPTHKKTNKLAFDAIELGLETNLGYDLKYVYTDAGYRKEGEWILTGENWTKGVCIIEFRRVCEHKNKAHDLESRPNEGLNVFENNLLVQDTDKAFRARTTYNNKDEISRGQWSQMDGQCVDHVIRGCYNNGTCVAPNTCQCSEGWRGFDCSIPICTQVCNHNGNCTLPNVCTCEKGWTGNDCSTPICSQNCNYGKCIAPDTCQCDQWANEWRDGRLDGGAPLFQKPNGDPQLTGWTGYDCSTPICVQAEDFLLNINIKLYTPEELSDLLVDLGGDSNCTQDQCYISDQTRTSNNGRSHQSGCGYDPIDTGCCELTNSTNNSIYRCYACNKARTLTHKRFTDCMENESNYYLGPNLVPYQFKDQLGSIKLCGSMYTGLLFSDRNSTVVSNSFLCNRFEWTQGDFVDNAGLGEISGVGGDIGLKIGRHTRVNFNNYIKPTDDSVSWEVGPEIQGEGIFKCYNYGSCIAPDTCHCKDGWSGFNCNTPLCRHLQSDGSIVGCMNGGICQDKDSCFCIQTKSVLWEMYNNVEHGMTGWAGSDCSMPVCVQGYYDPLCDSPFAPGGEGCFRCHNGGLCMAPDVCQCDKQWTGFDCKTPICEMQATPLIREQLMTEDEDKIRMFEKNPCSLEGIYKPENINGIDYPRGKCILPNKCACLCRGRKDEQYCKMFGGSHCRAPFQDSLHKHRNVLEPNELFGTRDCWSGYEGAVDEYDDFISCHMVIYEPDYFTENTMDIVIGTSASIALILISSWYIKLKLHNRQQQKIMERRKQRRGSLQNAFTHRETIHDEMSVNVDVSRPGTASSARSRRSSAT